MDVKSFYFFINILKYLTIHNFNERKKYKWKEKKAGDDFDNVPIKAFDHACDAIRYAVFTHLTRTGF